MNPPPASSETNASSRTRPLLLRALAFSVVSAFLVSPALATVKVDKKPPVVERKTFDPRHPPKEMPTLHAGEDAVTSYELDSTTEISVSITKHDLPGGKCRMVYFVRSVKVTMTCHITVWLPEGASVKLKAHEEGHREITETEYKTAEVPVRKLAEKVDGRNVVGEAEDCEKAANEKLEALNRTIGEGYRHAVVEPTGRVQAIYDELTAHGTKTDPDEKTAIRQSFEKQTEEAKQAAKAAATRPATKPAKGS